MGPSSHVSAERALAPRPPKSTSRWRIESHATAAAYTDVGCVTVRVVHVVGAVTQAPSTQSWFDEQAGFAPQRQAPEDEHESAFEPHATQAPPAVPHAAAVGVTQVLPWQQPEGHVEGVHPQTPPTQGAPPAQAGLAPHRHWPVDEQVSAPTPQALQAVPGAAQAVLDRVTQVLPEQQPLGHEVASHTHAPPKQR